MRCNFFQHRPLRRVPRIEVVHSTLGIDREEYPSIGRAREACPG
jgi:hypothetical protein